MPLVLSAPRPVLQGDPKTGSLRSTKRLAWTVFAHVNPALTFISFVSACSTLTLQVYVRGFVKSFDVTYTCGSLGGRLEALGTSWSYAGGVTPKPLKLEFRKMDWP